MDLTEAVPKRQENNDYGKRRDGLKNQRNFNNRKASDPLILLDNI